MKNMLYSLLVFVLLAVNASAQPATPSLSISPTSPKGLDDVLLIGSGGDGVTIARFQLAADPAFENIYLTFVNSTDALDAGQSISEYLVSNDRFPLNTPLYIRLQYENASGASPWSDSLQVALGAPEGLTLIYANDFEAVAVDQIPNGWEVFNTTTDTGPQGGYYYQELIQWVVKDVEFLTDLVYYPSYSDPRVVENDLKIADGNTLVAESGDYVDAQNFYETHIVTEEFNLSGVTDVVVAFNSNYIQNQDNIAILEYTLNDGSINIEDGAGLSALPIGDWYPVMYYLDGNPAGGDVIFDADGNVEVAATLDGTDDKGFTWREYIFADDNPEVGEAAIGDFILPRLDDHLMGPGGVNGEYDSKRWERFRVERLDNQPSVKFRFTYQGSWSWFWTIDNFQIWGVSATPVSDWSVY